MSALPALSTPAVGDPAALARLAVEALRLELDTYPKPGLVSRIDAGSHDDMDAATFEASAAALEPYFAALATLPAAQRDAVEAFVAAVRQEAAARRVATRDNGSRR